MALGFAKRKKTLKVDEIIGARSAVPAVSSRSKRQRIADQETAAKRERTGYVTHKELVQLRRLADGHHETTVTVTDASYDVWDAPVAPDVGRKTPQADPSTLAISHLPAQKPPPTLRQPPLTLAANGRPVPAVPLPGGAKSYNPSFPEYEAAYELEAAKAVAAEQARLDALAAEQARREAAERSAREAEEAEARAELSEWEEDGEEFSEWEGCASGPEEDDIVRVKKPERKTKAQRNKIKRRKEEERKRKHEEAMKRKEAQLAQVRKLAREVEKRERQKALVKAAGDDVEPEVQLDEDIPLRRKQLGRFRLPERDLELVLPDELQESLRLLRPEGNLLKERYRSLLVRGRLEARRHIPFRRRAKGKVTEKWSYKDFVLPS